MRLVVEERGSGPRTAWLLHGLGASRDHLHATADALDGRFRCLLPDLRGHGDTPPATPVTSLADYVDDLAPLVADDPGCVAGLSFGATLALMTWQRLPTAVEALALVDPALDPGALLATAGTRPDAYRALVAPYFERDREALVALMAEHPLTRGLDEASRRRNAASHLRADHETLLQTLDVLRREAAPAWTRPAGSATAVTVVRATRSPACPPAAARRVAEQLGGEVREVESGHAASLDAPAALAACLEAAFTPR